MSCRVTDLSVWHLAIRTILLAGEKQIIISSYAAYGGNILPEWSVRIVRKQRVIKNITSSMTREEGKNIFDNLSPEL